jgi:hypothetical protein
MRDFYRKILEQATERTTGDKRPLATRRQRAFAPIPVSLHTPKPPSPPATSQYFTIGTSAIGGPDTIKP